MNAEEAFYRWPRHRCDECPGYPQCLKEGCEEVTL